MARKLRNWQNDWRESQNQPSWREWFEWSGDQAEKRKSQAAPAHILQCDWKQDNPRVLAAIALYDATATILLAPIMSDRQISASCGEFSPEIFVKPVYNVTPRAEKITIYTAVGSLPSDRGCSKNTANRPFFSVVACDRL